MIRNKHNKQIEAAMMNLYTVIYFEHLPAFAGKIVASNLLLSTLPRSHDLLTQVWP